MSLLMVTVWWFQTCYLPSGKLIKVAVAMENHHLVWLIHDKWAIFSSNEVAMLVYWRVTIFSPRDERIPIADLKRAVLSFFGAKAIAFHCMDRRFRPWLFAPIPRANFPDFLT